MTDNAEIPCQSQRCTVKGEAPENPDTAPAPTDRTLPDGQKADHWVLCEAERAKGYVRPVRLTYQHVGIPGPKYPLIDLTPEELKRFEDLPDPYIKFEEYPESMSPVTGRYWSQKDLDAIDKGCGTVTTMPRACAETYARQPDYYGSTFCCGCRKYLPVGAHGEFIWDDGSGDRVGT